MGKAGVRYSSRRRVSAAPSSSMGPDPSTKSSRPVGWSSPPAGRPSFYTHCDAALYVLTVEG